MLPATRVASAAKAGSRLTTMFVRPDSALPIAQNVLASHDDRFTHCDASKVRQSDLSRQGRRPLPDHPVFADGRDLNRKSPVTGAFVMRPAVQ